MKDLSNLSTGKIYNSQKKLKNNCPQITSEKLLDLKLKGNFKTKYSSSGRFLMLSNNKSLASFDTKKLNLMFDRSIQNVCDMTFLHDETFLATVEKYETPLVIKDRRIDSSVYIYDKIGREQHHLSNHKNAEKAVFLPYHFLLASSSTDRFLRWTDVCTGKTVATKLIKEKTTALNQEPSTALLFSGSRNGTISSYSPSQKNFHTKILAYKSPVKSIDFYRNYIFTSNGSSIKCFDKRNLFDFVYKINTGNIDNITISKTGKIAISSQNKIKIFEEKRKIDEIKCNRKIYSLEFQPFEDILTVGSNGIFNLLVPGSGDPNYDTFEDNPFITKKQRQEREIKKLLEKIPYELIGVGLDNLKK